MAGFAIRNLKGLDDHGGEYAPGLELRFGRRSLASEHLGVTYMRFAPGYRLPLGHSHREQEEAYVVVSGSGWARLDDEVAALRRWDVLPVAATVVRSFEGGRTARAARVRLRPARGGTRCSPAAGGRPPPIAGALSDELVPGPWAAAARREAGLVVRQQGYALGGPDPTGRNSKGRNGPGESTASCTTACRGSCGPSSAGETTSGATVVTYAGPD